jgi:site-specific DNA-methyltransferase (adenine-specific)
MPDQVDADPHVGEILEAAAGDNDAALLRAGFFHGSQVVYTSMRREIDSLTMDLEHVQIGRSLLIHGDCLEWLRRAPEASIHAVVTDPPYGVKEYNDDQLEKRANGNGGVWRIPPSYDGHERSPLPRFTALDVSDRERMRSFFEEWSRSVNRVLRPGAHVFIATNAFIAQLLYEAVVAGGLEFRGQIIRLVRTLRGGDRPKNAEAEYPGVCSMPKGCYEPWGLFRKPLLAKMTVGECLRRFQTGGLRRRANDKPFEDVIESERTSRLERRIADHPSLKPQSFLRRICHAALPLGEGIILDPFAGSGSTIAAAEALGLTAIGVERLRKYYDLACAAVPRLKGIEIPIVDCETAAQTGHPTLF